MTISVVAIAEPPWEMTTPETPQTIVTVVLGIVVAASPLSKRQAVARGTVEGLSSAERPLSVMSIIKPCRSFALRASGGHMSTALS